MYPRAERKKSPFRIIKMIMIFEDHTCNYLTRSDGLRKKKTHKKRNGLQLRI